MKTNLPNCLKVLVISFLASVGTIRAEETVSESDRAAVKLARTIQNSECKTVAVFPVLFKRELNHLATIPNQSNAVEGGLSELLNSKKNRPQILVSAISKLHAEQMQASLARISQDRFRVVAATAILESLQEQRVDFTELHPHSPSFAKITVDEAPVDAIVTGVMQERLDGQDYTVRDIQWEIFKPSQSAILNTDSETDYANLAEAIYDGVSCELFRWKGRSLQVQGYSYEWLGQARQKRQASIPLKPSDSIDLYEDFAGGFNQPYSGVNPVFNDHCPYKVSFKVNGEVSGLHLALDRTSIYDGTGLTEKLVPISNPYLAVEPGDDLKLNVRNDGTQEIRVAIFIDGVNILGTKRELPDEKSAVWILKPGQEGGFGAWYSGRKGEEVQSEFIITPWSASIAGKLGMKEQARQITVVVFTLGWPNRNQLTFYPRGLQQLAFWNSSKRRIEVSETLESAESVGMGVQGIGVGGKKPVPGALTYSVSKPPGTILAAITVKYADSSVIREVIHDEINQQTPWRANSNKDKLQIVVSPTSNRYVP